MMRKRSFFLSGRENRIAFEDLFRAPWSDLALLSVFSPSLFSPFCHGKCSTSFISCKWLSLFDRKMGSWRRKLHLIFFFSPGRSVGVKLNKCWLLVLENPSSCWWCHVHILLFFLHNTKLFSIASTFTINWTHFRYCIFFFVSREAALFSREIHNKLIS